MKFNRLSKSNLKEGGKKGKVSMDLMMQRDALKLFGMVILQILWI